VGLARVGRPEHRDQLAGTTPRREGVGVVGEFEGAPDLFGQIPLALPGAQVMEGLGQALADAAQVEIAAGPELPELAQVGFQPLGPAGLQVGGDLGDGRLQRLLQPGALLLQHALLEGVANLAGPAPPVGLLAKARIRDVTKDPELVTEDGDAPSGCEPYPAAADGPGETQGLPG